MIFITMVYRHRINSWGQVHKIMELLGEDRNEWITAVYRGAEKRF